MEQPKPYHPAHEPITDFLEICYRTPSEANEICQAADEKSEEMEGGEEEMLDELHGSRYSSSPSPRLFHPTF